MPETMEIRQALRFLDDLCRVRQSIQARLHAPTAAPAPAPTPCPALAPLPPEDEDRGYAQAEALLHAGDTTAALERLQDLATRGALRWDIHNDLGTLLLNAGQLEAGLQALKTAVSLEFSSTQALRNLIVAYVQQGEVANALAASGLLLRKEPRSPDILAFLRDLLLETSPRLDDYGWLSPSIALRLNNEQRLQRYVTTTAPTHQNNQIKAELYDWVSSNLRHSCREPIHSKVADRYCVFCETTVDHWTPYRSGKASPFTAGLGAIGSNIERFGCPACESHDRERHLFLYLRKLDLLTRINKSKILHIAPEKCLAKSIESYHPETYIKGDISPSAPGTVLINIESTTFQNSHFDWVICNHVLEHVNNATRALLEVFRLLKPGGIFICQTPYATKLAETFESPHIENPDERFLYFGQEDHLRLFGKNIDKVIRSAGFEGKLLYHHEILSDVDPDYYGVNEFEPFFLFKKPEKLTYE